MALTLFDESGVSLTRDGPVMTLAMNRGENRINLEMTNLLHAALEAAEAEESPKVLIITSASDKFFCNGLDVDWMGKNADKLAAMFKKYHDYQARLLTMHCPTVCAINGHCFGAGLFMALCCDWRVMRTEKGFANFPELNLGMRISKQFAEIAKCKCSPQVLREGFLTGKRYSSVEALQAGLIDAETPIENLAKSAREHALSMLPKALKLINFSPSNFTNMKIELYTDAYRALQNGDMSETPKSRL